MRKDKYDEKAQTYLVIAKSDPIAKSHISKVISEEVSDMGGKLNIKNFEMHTYSCKCNYCLIALVTINGKSKSIDIFGIKKTRYEAYLDIRAKIKNLVYQLLEQELGI